ncbi:hypothetical protein GJ496_006718 [Pomphorhynchus laevis]|nr:hypothetical protein GJ496_006718 [Pomphorhynchus laevis]
MTAYSSTIQQDPILPYTHQHLQHFQRPISIKKELKRTTTESYSTEYFCCPTSVQQQTPLRLIDPNYLHISDPISTDRIDNLSNINAEYITPNLYTYPNLQESNFFDLDQYKNDNGKFKNRTF